MALTDFPVEKETVMDRTLTQHQGKTDSEQRQPGDPGVGGLLSDPLKPSRQHETPDPSAGAPSPDPEPPRHHGDWMPPRKAADRTAPSARLASITRRKSRSGMPRALFREDDDSTLDDLRALVSQMRG